MPDGRLLSPADLTSLGGSTIIVVAISNGLQYALGWNPKIVALVASFAVAGVGVAASEPQSGTAWFLGFANAFVIYCSSVGVAVMGNALAHSKARRRADRGRQAPQVEEVGAAQAKFWVHWFQPRAH
jgi:hypothetical protein